MKKRHLIIIFVFIFGWVSFIYAQSDDRLVVKPVDSDDTPLVNDQDYPEILLELSPLNDEGIPVAALTDINFTLVDGDTLLKDVTAVPFINIDQRVSVMVVLDVSGPMQPWMLDVKTAVEPFYVALETWDESAVIALAAEVDLNNTLTLDPTREWGFTNDEGALRNLINAQRADPNAGTPLYDGLYKGIRMTAVQAAHPRRVVLLVTNGADQNGSEGAAGSRIANENIVIEESRNNNVPIFTIGLGNDADIAFLQRAAILTGGTFTQAANESELADALTGVVHQLKQAYRLTATAVTPPDNQPHPLTLTVSSPAGVEQENISFNAWYPSTPQIEDIQLVLDSGERISLKTVQAANSVLTIEPQIVARHDIAAVNYYVDGEETAVFQATSPPWTFSWDTTALPTHRPVSLIVEVVDASGASQIVRSETRMNIKPCDIFCQSGIPPLLLSIVLLLLLLLALGVLVVMLVRRMRAGTAVQPTVSVPQPYAAEQPAAAPFQPQSFQRSGPAIEVVPNVNDSFPPASQIVSAIPVLVNEVTNESFPLQYDVRIGRDAGTNIRLSGNTVADRHALIKRENSRYVLVINGRHNMSTSINDTPVDQRKVLADGDVIHIGEHRLRFVASH